MALPQPPEPVLPVTGLLGAPPFPDGLLQRLEAILGPCRRKSAIWSFDATDYYTAEMGPGLARQLLAFAPTTGLDLALWKAATNRLEQAAAGPRGRRVNLDPGYLTLGGLFLASAKPRPHRIWLGGGFYGELTLVYQRGAWQPLPWTFPDFRAGTYHPFLTHCRDLLREARRLIQDPERGHPPARGS